MMEYTPLTPEQAKEVMRQWRNAVPLLQRVREDDIRNADTVKAMQALAGCFNMALRELPPRQSSGMVEMQRLFMRAHARSTAK